MPNEESVGYLRVAVSTAEEAIPIRDARVTVTGEGETRVLFTDESGLTALFALPAPPAEASTSAFGENPFASYRVVVSKDGFYEQTTEYVPIFAGVTARQGINLIGLAELTGDQLPPSASTDTVTRDPQVLHNTREAR